MQTNKGELFINELLERNIIQNITNKDKVIKALNNNQKIYAGFDPSAPSLHLGNFVIINILSLCQKYDIDFVVIIGGQTGLIGDPSGKKSERILLDTSVVKNNVLSIKNQLQTLLQKALIVNNADFYTNLSITDFLRDVGKYINVSYLLNKEIIKNRLEDGISFTEFSYPLIQANDFYVLYHNYGVCVELGGSDQWGNITIGIDYINKKDKIADNDSDLCGITVKLLLKSDGTKFGKSEKGAIYLSEQYSSIYSMYQFLINQKDEDCLNLLNFLTDYSIQEIQDIWQEHLKQPSARYCQKQLARNLVSRIHSLKSYETIKKISELLFSNDLKQLSTSDIALIKKDFPIINYDFNFNTSVLDLLVNTKICASKREARILITQGGISLSGQKIHDVNALLTKDYVLAEQFIFIKKGKQNYEIIEKA